MEYCPGGELYSLIYPRNPKPKAGLGMRLTQYYGACVLLALEHLHANNIIYNDLKPENVVISADGKAKLTDFGISIMGNGAKNGSCNCIPEPNHSTLYITAPEVLNGKAITVASDWWSFGCLLYEIFTGQQPFNGFSNFQLKQNIINEQPRANLRKFPELNDLPFPEVFQVI